MMPRSVQFCGAGAVSIDLTTIQARNAAEASGSSPMTIASTAPEKTRRR
jgi:hypothetical protein